MFDTIMGLPVHPLVIHAVVVLIPTAAAGAVALALVTRWRESFRFLVLALATLALAGVWVAIQSGEALKERLDAGGVIATQIERHQDQGELMLWPTLALWVLIVILVALHGRPHPKAAARVLAVLIVVVGLATMAQVGLVGHSGATAVWSCTIGSDLCK